MRRSMLKVITETLLSAAISFCRTRLIRPALPIIQFVVRSTSQAYRSIS